MAEILQTSPNTLRVGINAVWDDSRNISNVQHWVFDQDPSIANAESAVEEILTAWQDIILDGVPPNYVLTGANWLVMSTADSPSGLSGPVAGHSTAGSGLGAPLPSNVSVLVHKEAASSGRRAKNGRLYLPPGDEAAVNPDGSINTTPLSQLQAMMDSYYTAIAQVGVSNVGVYATPHWYKVDKPDVETGGIWASPDFSPITGLRVDGKVATQRRRLR